MIPWQMKLRTFFIFSGSTLTCYECNQPTGKGLACESNPGRAGQKVCNGNQTQCITYIWGGK